MLRRRGIRRALLRCAPGRVHRWRRERHGVEPRVIVSSSDSSASEAPPLFEDATPRDFSRGTTWTNEADLADIDADGDVDVLFADGGDYDKAGRPVRSRIFSNEGDGRFTEVSEQVLGDAVGAA